MLNKDAASVYSEPYDLLLCLKVHKSFNMSKVFFDVAMSLDGFIAGENSGPQNPLGDHGPDLHNWMFRQKAFWNIHGEDKGEEDSEDGRIIEEVFARTGSSIMGKRMFEEGEKNWPEDLFKMDVFVLTHEKRQPWIQRGSTVFYFTNEGIETVLHKAKKSAGNKDVRINGGAETIQQFLNAGLVDECTIHISPILLGGGISLFNKINKDKFRIEIERAQESVLTTHLWYLLSKR
jgi:dihydrofolate reductase